MRIAAARVIPLRLRFSRPMATARGEYADRESVLLELEDPDGRVGYGEAAPWPGFATETAAAAEAVLRGLAPVIEGADLEPGESTATLARLLGDGPAARAALQGALWDLEARRAGRPLAGHLAARAGPTGGAALERVAVSALLAGREPEAVREEARRARAAGHRAVKLKLGRTTVADDVARVRAVREALGPEIRLRGDANGAWSAAAALEALQAMAAFDVEYVEQPVPADDIAGLALVRRRAAVRVAADESVASEAGLSRLIDAGAADVVVLKPAMLGGPARTLQLARRARHAGLGVVFTHALESAVGACHALHCAAAWGDPDGIHGLQTQGLFEADVAVPPAAAAGCIAVPASPGLGIEL